MSGFADAFAEHEARFKAAVMRDTWGHLDASPGVYDGYIVFTHGTYGDIVVIDNHFEGLSDSPWLYDHIYDKVNKFVDTGRTERGRVYRFDGVYIRQKNGGHRWRGVLTQIALK